MAWSGSEFEETMAKTRTQTTSRNLLLQTYIHVHVCAAELAPIATWGVGHDVNTPQVREKLFHAM